MHNIQLSLQPQRRRTRPRWRTMRQFKRERQRTLTNRSINRPLQSLSIKGLQNRRQMFLKQLPHPTRVRDTSRRLRRQHVTSLRQLRRFQFQLKLTRKRSNTGHRHRHHRRHLTMLIRPPTLRPNQPLLPRQQWLKKQRQARFQQQQFPHTLK